MNKKLALPFQALILLAGVILVTGLFRFKANGRMYSSPVSDCLTNAEAAAARGLTLELIEMLHTARGLTNSEICTMPEDKLERAIVKAGNPRPDSPGDALEFRLLGMRDEHGNIPDDAYSKAAAHMEVMRAQANVLNLAIDPQSWTWIGPGNVGGRVRSILIHPNDPTIMWAGSVSGGIWKTSNGGASWYPEDDFMANLSVSSLVMDPRNPNTIFAGTGEGFSGGSGIRGEGVFKTNDGGATWSQLPATANSDWYYVSRIAISADGATMLAGTRSGIFRSTNGGATWNRTMGDETLDLDFHPFDNSQAIAGGRRGARAWYSTDAGRHWSAAAFDPPLPTAGANRVELAYAPSNPAIVYASIEIDNGEVWRSVDGGRSYVLANRGTNYLGSQGWYDNIIWVDPTDPSVVIVGGIDLYRSTDNGNTLAKISQWYLAPSSAHADHHAIVEHPDFDGATNSIVYFGNDGGVYRADNVYTVYGTSGWQELNNNLGITQFYGAAGNANSGVIVGGTQDNGTLRFSGGNESWDTMAGGDGGYSAADPNDPNFFYNEYVYLKIRRSTDGGATASYIYSGIADAGNCANFIAPFVLDPNDPNILLAGGCSLWRSTNVKAPSPTWTAIGPPARNQLSAVAVAQGNGNIIWVGDNFGNIHKTSNGRNASPTWTLVETVNDLSPANLPDRMVKRITIDPRNHDTVYVTLGGFSPSNVWRTDDGGLTWSDATGSGATGLPQVPVHSLVIHPDDSQRIYVGTQVGVFASQDRGATWALPQDGPANVSVEELFWLDKKLVAATHGRGLYMTGPSSLTGHVRGRVTAEGTGASLNGILVTAYRRSHSRWDWTAEQSTNNNGDYDMELLPGSYRIEFRDSADTYISEYYFDEPNSSAATEVVVNAGDEITEIDAALAENGRIRGRITSEREGLPLEGIYVQAWRYHSDDDWYEWFADATTNSNGRYELSGLDLGTYHIEFVDHSHQYSREFYDDAPDLINASDVSVISGQVTTGIDGAMAHTGYLTGRVTAAHDDAPVSDITVVALGFDPIYGTWDWVADSTTGGNGEYFISGLDVGVYRVRYDDYTNTYARAFYDNVTTLEDATEVPVVSDRITADIDAVLLLTGNIAGTVTAAANGLTLPDVTAVVWAFDSANEVWRFERSETTDSDGRYKISGLDPASYRVGFEDYSRTYATAYFDEAVDLLDATDVVVVSGRTSANIDAALVTTGGIAGMVTSLADASPLENIAAEVWRYDRTNSRWEWVVEAYTESDGTYMAGGLDPGSYRVRFTDWSLGYAPQYYDGELDRVAAREVVVGSGAITGGIDAALGTVLTPDNDAFAAASPISTVPYRTSLITVAASVVEDDPTIPCVREQKFNTVWFRFTPQVDGPVTISTADSDYDTVLALWQGSRGELQNIACNDDYEVSNVQARLDDVPVLAGQSYFLEVASFGDSAGILTLDVSASPGQITGSVTSEGDGSPLHNIQVDLLQFDSLGNIWEVIAGAKTGPDGRYMLAAVNPGIYRLHFRDPSQRYVGEYYAGAAVVTAARDVIVLANRATVEIDASLVLKEFKVFAPVVRRQ